MNLKFILTMTLLAAFWAVPHHSSAAPTSAPTPLPNYDSRENAARTGMVSRVQSLALEKLRGRVAGLSADFDPITGGAKNVSVAGGFLSGPAGRGSAIPAVGLARFAGDSNGVTKAFLAEHQELFGHGAEALDTARVSRDYVTPHNGLHTVVWEQQVGGIRVFDAVLMAHTTRQGELIKISSQFVSNPDAAATRGTPGRAALATAPTVTAARAVALAAQNIELPLAEEKVVALGAAESGGELRQRFSAPGLKGEADAKLVWLPLDRDTLRLCWDVTLMSRARGEMFRVLLDAETGEVRVRRCLTSYLTDATYNVYTSDSPSPFSPGWPTPNTNQPALVARTLVTLPAMDTNASPAGWINDDGNQTWGNNVDAHTDRNNDNLPDVPRPQGSPFRVFNFPMNLATQDPTNYSAAAVVQLFYLCNWYHDKLYALGFTEAAGNFQSNNFARGGLGNDAVQADAQDGSGTDNANFSTPPDGSAGRMQMYIFTGPSPRRDGDFDAEIVFHEHTHGLSWRLVGGGQALGDTQSDGMGEGWSDFYGLCLLSQAGDDVNANYAAGGYATYRLGGLTQNYYYGIRRYPYTTDLTKNPLTFKDIDPAQASAHAEVSRSPIIGTTANEVHNEGEVWCVTLWEARANLINKFGWAVGNQLILQLVTDGMKLTVPHPNFLQARDGILQADLVDNGGANQNELWAAFAKRGLGFSATSPASSTTTGLHESFDVPDDFRINPLTGLNSGGQIGGPFTPACRNYSITNVGSNTITWVAAVTQPWVTLGSTGGTLPVGSGGSVSVCLNASANTLPAGNYSASVNFSNLTSGRSFTRSVSLVITPPQVIFYSLDSDPGWTRQGEWAFGKPAGLGGTSFGFPDPTSGYTGSNVFGINLNGDYSTVVGGPYYLTTGPINCSAFTTLRLQFQRWLNADFQNHVIATLEISTNTTTWSMIWSNGTSTVADSAWTPVLYDISAYADRKSSVYLRWGHRVGLSGAFAYSGWNLDDIALLGIPTAPRYLLLPGSVAENAGVLPNAGSVQLVTALPTNLVVTLTSSVPARMTVPPTVTVLAGQLSAPFDLTLVDNSINDGDQLVSVTASGDGYPDFAATVLVVNDEAPPVVTTQPASLSVSPGASATFSVSATGKAPLSYFWRRNGVIIPGATAASYTTNNVAVAASGSLYSCLVSNNFGTVPSSNAVLTVIAAPANDLCANATLITATRYTNTLSTTNATSTGDPAPSCVGSFGKGVWYVYTVPANGQLVVDTIGSLFDTGLGVYTGTCATPTLVGCDDDGGGSLTSLITLTVTGGTTYRILAGGFGGSSGTLVFHTAFTSSAVPPTITVQPASLTVPSGNSAAFSVTATGSTPLSYFWSRNGTPITGANTSTYTTNNVQLADSGAGFSCLVSNAFGSVPSSNAVLTVVTSSPSITQQPASLTVFAGGTATFGVIATGSQPLSYYWQRNGSPIPGANGSSYTTNNVQLADSGNLFSCLVSNAYGFRLSSNAVLSVSSGPIALAGDYLYLPIESNGVFVANSSGGRFNAAGTGGSGGVDFWYPGVPVYNYVVAVAGVNYVNGNFLSRSITNLSVAGLQHALINAVVRPGLSYARDISFVNNSKVIKIVDTLQNTGGVALTNLVTLDTTDPDQDSVSSSTFATLNDVVSVLASNDLVLASGPVTGLTLGLGSDAGFRIPSANGFNNMDAYAQLAVIDPNGASGDIDINLAHNYGTLPPGQTQSVTWFMVFGTSPAEVTNAFAVNSGFAPVITNQPVSQRVSPGCGVSFSVLAGGVGPVNYQWWRDGFSLAGQTNSTLTLSNLTLADYGNYFVVVGNGFGFTTSSNAVLTPNHPPTTVQDIVQRNPNGDVKVQVAVLLSNDSDPDGDPVSFVGVSSNSVAGGSVSWSGNWVYYLPPPGYTNSDAFTYTVSDGLCGPPATGTVLVQVMTPLGPSHNFTIQALPDGSLRLRFAGIPGWTYRVQFTDALPPTNWLDLAVRTADSLGIYEFVDAPPTNAPSRFYRSVSP